jgi:hypothetical protein
MPLVAAMCMNKCPWLGSTTKPKHKNRSADPTLSMLHGSTKTSTYNLEIQGRALPKLDQM